MEAELRAVGLLSLPLLRAIRDLLCFFNERVDLVVDGVLRERPVSPWSNGETDAGVAHLLR